MLVADYTNHRVQRFSSTGAFIETWGSQGTGAGQLSFPVSIAVAHTAPIVVVESGNKRVQRFSASGTSTGMIASNLLGPFGVALDGLGLVFVTQAAANLISPYADATTPALRVSWGALKRRYQ